MSTQTIYLSGTAKWCRIYEGQMDVAFNKERYGLDLYPDEASLIVMKTSGSRLKQREDEDGKYFKISRDNRRVFDGKEAILGPPKVVTKDSEGRYIPFDQIVGNGSKVTVKLSIYNTKLGPGTRLEAVCVDEHVPYEKNSDGETDYAF